MTKVVLADSDPSENVGHFGVDLAWSNHILCMDTGAMRVHSVRLNSVLRSSRLLAYLDVIMHAYCP